ncbi:MAG: glutathione S-transferase family protein [Alphaproteobacteria bacterium]|nr:glutathione S-transferase family protein [Alphaproteobacteria bacterium]MBR1756479.1 glutathione S-transferase family protein [Alphaproteobacteria bacterium]
MVLLIHHTTSPFARKIRLQMSEKRMLFVLRSEEPWNLSQDVYKLNPAGELPIYLNDGKIISSHYAICEYLEETNPDVPLIFGTPEQKAEIRRMTDWFDNKFYREVYRNIVWEKVHKRFARGQSPDSVTLKAGLNNLGFHFEYIEWLFEKHAYLAGEELSLADLSAGAHISVIDYLGDVPWDEFPLTKLWYSKIKSRPAFKDLLKDTIAGIIPSRNYTNLDF